MSRLIAQILLSLLVFPLGGLIYTIVFVLLMESRVFGMRYREMPGFLIAGLVTWAFIAIYWWMMWRKSVIWTPARVGRTWICFVAAAVVAMICGTATGAVNEGFGSFVGSVAAPLLWQFGTVLIWRENPAERAGRLSGPGSQGVVCPTCGYNLTGLKSTRCPECGSEFTLDQLFASQPERVPEELAT